MILRFLVLFIVFFLSRDSVYSSDLLPTLDLPKGFEITYFAKDVEDARSMTLGPRGVVFVGTRSESVYALLDKNLDGVAEKRVTIAEGLNMPNGVAYRRGSLYVAEVNRILKFSNIRKNLKGNRDYEVFFSDLPDKRHHGWKFIKFGPDGDLYIPIGAPCNICLSKDKRFATISKLSMKHKILRPYAHGVRNSVGFDWEPGSKRLWFTDNGRDWMGDDSPPEEINIVRRKDEHFGYPFCHGSDISDPKFGKGKDCQSYSKPVIELGAHQAALGMRFYKKRQFPKKYRSGFFVALHGSWNHSEKVGYKVIWANPKTKVVKTFITGWLRKDRSVWGRPVDVEVYWDGSLLISDDYNNVIYRVTYKK